MPVEGYWFFGAVTSVSLQEVSGGGPEVTVGHQGPRQEGKLAVEQGDGG